MPVQLQESSIEEASAQFWEQMLSMKLYPMSTHDFYLGSGHLLGSVGLTGAWSGRVEIRMDERLSREATAAMLMQATEDVTEADALDAAKEITNMLAGVIKSSLPRPSAMTVPEARVVNECYCSAMRNLHSVAVAFRHDSGEMIVSVLMQGGTGDPAGKDSSRSC